jgi:hypothetical protein
VTAPAPAAELLAPVRIPVKHALQGIAGTARTALDRGSDPSSVLNDVLSALDTVTAHLPAYPVSDEDGKDQP